jgi:hypothetical protein
MRKEWTYSLAERRSELDVALIPVQGSSPARSGDHQKDVFPFNCR